MEACLQWRMRQTAFELTLTHKISRPAGDERFGAGTCSEIGTLSVEDHVAALIDENSRQILRRVCEDSWAPSTASQLDRVSCSYAQDQL